MAQKRKRPKSLRIQNSQLDLGRNERRITITLFERYESLKALVTERKAEFENLCEFVEKQTEYITAPASSRFHLCKESGLLEHSLNVAETMLKLKNTLAPEISDESCVVTALFHDLGKVGMPDNPMYVKNIGKNGKAPSIPYSCNNNMTYMSIPLRSLYFILPLFPLTPEETQAIMYHDGQYVDDNKSVATKECPLLFLLQYADSWSTFVIEKNIF